MVDLIRLRIYIFSAMIAKLEKEGEGVRRFNKIRAVIAKFLESSGYSQIKLGYIFETLFPKPGTKTA